MTNFNPINNYNIINNYNFNCKTPQKEPQNEVINTINQELLLDFKTFDSDNQNLLKYLKNLLNYPTSIEQFLKNLNNKTINNKELEILINNNVDLKILSRILSSDSKIGLKKVLTQIEYLSQNFSQNHLSEILSTLNSLQVSKETLKEFLLLYIPINFETFEKRGNFGDFELENKEEIKNSTLSIMFQTLNYSNILITLVELNNSLLIDFFVNETFPEAKFTLVVKEFSKNNSINVDLNKKAIKIENETKKQSFRIISNDFVSINIILICNFIIKTILKFDNDFSI